MSIYTPYFYIIQDKRNGIYYAGAKWAKDANPSNFMVEGGYETSSDTIKELIRHHGLSNFIIRKIRAFETGEAAHDYETRFLQKVDARNHPRFYNGHNNDRFGFADSSFRKIIGPDGLTSYQRGGRKAAETKKSTFVDGLNLHQIAYYKALENNPNLHKIRTENMMRTNTRINSETGMNKFQENGRRILGENNPSKKPENAKKISEAMKKFITENSDKWQNFEQMVNYKLNTERDENDLTARDRHSIWMLENNPTRETKWFNNGKVNKRIKDGEQIPYGFAEGRLPIKKHDFASSYYNNGIRNIKVKDGCEVPTGFTKGFLKKENQES